MVFTAVVKIKYDQRDGVFTAEQAALQACQDVDPELVYESDGVEIFDQTGTSLGVFYPRPE